MPRAPVVSPTVMTDRERGAVQTYGRPISPKDHGSSQFGLSLPVRVPKITG